MRRRRLSVCAEAGATPFAPPRLGTRAQDNIEIYFDGKLDDTLATMARACLRARGAVLGAFQAHVAEVSLGPCFGTAGIAAARRTCWCARQPNFVRNFVMLSVVTRS